MPEIQYIARKEFKYGEEYYKPGDEFIPTGGKWDSQIIDPSNKLITVREILAHKCDACGKVFSSKQGLGAHTRFCKGG